MRRNNNTKGFTLVEVLIALSLFSIILGLFSSSIFSMSQTAQASTQRMSVLDNTRTARQFIQSQLSQIVPLSYREDSELIIFFRGYSDKLLYTGQLPSHRGGGGLHFIKLELDKSTTDILLSAIPAQAVTDFEHLNGNDWQENILLKNVEQIKFSYYGKLTNSGAPQWHNEWPLASHLPALIKLEFIAFDNTPWPPLVVSPRRLTVANQPQWVWQIK